MGVSPCLVPIHLLRSEVFEQVDHQGLTFVHFSAQPERFLWVGGRLQGLFGGVQEVFRRCQAVSGGVYDVLCVGHRSS